MSNALKTDIILKSGDLAPTGTTRQGRDEFMLMRDVIFEAKAPGSGVGVIVPAGYITDRYSLPGLFRGFQPEAERWLLPALVHDWLYDVGQYPRGRCDAIFSEAMKACGVKWWHRYGAFIGVRVGGAKGYGKPVQSNEALVNRAREQGLHSWGEDRDSRYRRLPERLAILQALHTGEPVKMLQGTMILGQEAEGRGGAGSFPADALPGGKEGVHFDGREHQSIRAYREAPFTHEPFSLTVDDPPAPAPETSSPGEAAGFDPAAFFHGADGIRDVLWPHGISKRAVEGCERIIACFSRFAPAGTRQQLAYILATAFHETAFKMQPVRETLASSDERAIAKLDRDFAAGRLPTVSKPYWRDGFFGRGLVQLTHERNYAGPLRDAVMAEFGDGFDILAKPALLIDDFDVSAYVLIEGMMRGDTSKGDFTADALEDHVNAVKADYEAARRVVNPGDRKTYATIAAQARAFEAALKGAGWSQAALKAAA